MSFIRDEDPIVIVSSICIIVAVACLALLSWGSGAQQLILSGFGYIRY